MATITEDYVSFETAKLLKERGFEGDVNAYYHIWDNGHRVCPIREFTHSEAPHLYIPAPTQSMAMKWLREMHGLHISLEPCYDYESMHVVFLAFVQNVADVHEFMDGRKNVASNPNAEKSCEAAIKHCLKKLI